MKNVVMAMVSKSAMSSRSGRSKATIMSAAGLASNSRLARSSKSVAGAKPNLSKAATFSDVSLDGSDSLFDDEMSGDKKLGGVFGSLSDNKHANSNSKTNIVGSGATTDCFSSEPC